MAFVMGNKLLGEESRVNVPLRACICLVLQRSTVFTDNTKESRLSSDKSLWKRPSTLLEVGTFLSMESSESHK